MKKFLSFFILILVLANVSFVKAQTPQVHLKTTAVPVTKPTFKPNILSFGPNDVGACDTVNFDQVDKWGYNYYTNPNGGYSFGVGNNVPDGITITEDANLFNVTAGGFTYSSGGLVKFIYANSNKKEDLDKDLIFKIYDNVNGYPGNLLGSTSLKLSKIHQDVLNDAYTEFKFPSPVELPGSKTFFISIDHSNFTWGAGVRDSIAIAANDDNDTTAAAYQFWDLGSGFTTWINVSDFYPATDNSTLDINLYIFPYVSNGIGGCTVLPVNVINFGGFVQGSDVRLNWSTASENNNKGFYIERSKDAQNFTNIGFVAGAGNSSQIKNYTYTDATIKNMNATTSYYRLKQVDLDGKTTYSKVLALNLKNVAQWRVYPNPVKDVATIELNLTASSKVNVQVIAQDGRVLINADKGVLAQGTQQVFINTQNLAKGSYIVRVKTDNDAFSKTIVKE